jgi:hypothetical protein
MIEIVYALPEHTKAIAQHMRQEDRHELKKYWSRSPIRGLNESLKSSLMAWTALKHGVPIAMFGACELGCLSEDGVIWFLGTDAVTKHAKEFVLYAGHYIHTMLSVFESLANVIDPDNKLAVRYAKYLEKTMPCVTVEKKGLGIELMIRRS